MFLQKGVINYCLRSRNVRLQQSVTILCDSTPHDVCFGCVGICQKKIHEGVERANLVQGKTAALKKQLKLETKKDVKAIITMC